MTRRAREHSIWLFFILSAFSVRRGVGTLQYIIKGTQLFLRQ